MFPDPGTLSPDLDAFGEAQDRKRSFIGSDITFWWPINYNWDAALPKDSNGMPLDPAASCISSAQASATFRGGVFFKAINRGGAVNSEISGPIGMVDRTPIFVNLNATDGAAVEGAVEFDFHGTRFKIDSIKWDEIVLGYRRRLIYGYSKGQGD